METCYLGVLVISELRMMASGADGCSLREGCRVSFRFTDHAPLFLSRACRAAHPSSAFSLHVLGVFPRPASKALHCWITSFQSHPLLLRLDGSVLRRLYAPFLGDSPSCTKKANAIGLQMSSLVSVGFPRLCLQVLILAPPFDCLLVERL